MSAFHRESHSKATQTSVRLRDHPLMVRESGIVSWPPEWTPVAEACGSLRGEVGVLREVGMHERIANKILLAMEHEFKRSITVLAFDDETFARQLYPLLIASIGQHPQNR